jgi:phenylacetate-CoA ligase
MSSISDKVYQHSPAFIQNFMVTGYGLKIYRREYGRKFREKLEEYDKIQWYSYDKLIEFQNQRLSVLIKHCYDNVPYYRKIMSERKLVPDDILCVADLAKLPILTRETIARNGHELIDRNAKHSQLIHGHTSGTTGSPLQFYYDKETCLIKNVFDWRQKRWAGINPGDKIAFFLGRVVVPLSITKPPFWRTNRIMNHTFFSSFHLSGENFGAYIKKLRQLSPSAIEGYPSTMYLVARLILSRGETLPLKAVFTSSETLFPQQRETIEKAFQCRLFDFFGLAERTVFASECQNHEGHHLNMDFGITEILKSNNEPVSLGEMGYMVTTGLYNWAMPLIRYRLNDVTAIKTGACSCGRAFPLMDDVTTKAEDIITTVDGRYISSSILTHPFKPLHTVAESQIIQEDREHVTVKLITLPGYKESDTQYLLTELQKRIGNGMKIEIEFVDNIPRTASGKFRWVISKVSLDI